MREATFINKNKKRWETLEEMFKGKVHPSADEVSDIFVQLTDDLSYARTFYPGSNTVVYLNGLSQLLHQRIYQNKKVDRSAFSRFWIVDIPLTIARNHRKLLLSFIMFSIAILIGVVSGEYDENFARLILSDGYVDMTIENIEKGNPTAVYATYGQFLMFLLIALNNMVVSFIMFLGGIFLSIGAGLILIRNGIMVGVFQYFFFQHDVGIESALAIWIHGTLEISAIIVAGAAGLTLGSGFLLPGTHSRLYSFKKSALDGLKIMVSLVPVILTAAFLEGYVTRLSPEMHPGWSLLIIGLSLIFVIFYYVVYPILLQRRIANS